MKFTAHWSGLHDRAVFQDKATSLWQLLAGELPPLLLRRIGNDDWGSFAGNHREDVLAAGSQLAGNLPVIDQVRGAIAVLQGALASDASAIAVVANVGVPGWDDAVKTRHLNLAGGLAYDSAISIAKARSDMGAPIFSGRFLHKAPNLTDTQLANTLMDFSPSLYSAVDPSDLRNVWRKAVAGGKHNTAYLLASVWGPMVGGGCGFSRSEIQDDVMSTFSRPDTAAMRSEVLHLLLEEKSPPRPTKLFDVASSFLARFGDRCAQSLWDGKNMTADRSPAPRLGLPAPSDKEQPSLEEGAATLMDFAAQDLGATSNRMRRRRRSRKASQDEQFAI